MRIVTVAVLALSAAVLVLAATIVLVAWWHLLPRWPATLTDDEIADRLAPVVASKLLTFASDDTEPPVEDWAT